MSYSQLNQAEHHADLVTFAKLAGVEASPEVLRVLTDMLRYEVNPEEIYILLKQICQNDKPIKKSSHKGHRK